MDYNKIKELIGNGNDVQINNYLAYIQGLVTKKKQGGVLSNPWMQHRTPEFLARIYKAVVADNLVFDGADVSLQSTGVSYSYQAYKNRMFSVYPESIIDVSIVYKDDAFQFEKNSGKVTYNHKISNPFNHQDKDIIGGYCVIKNKRGDFLTMLTRAEIDKHRKVAKTDYIWKAWFVEMAMKTVIKKACKTHFKDSFTTIETLDNENYDLEKIKEPVDKEEKKSKNMRDTIIGLLDEKDCTDSDKRQIIKFHCEKNKCSGVTLQELDIKELKFFVEDFNNTFDAFLNSLNN